MSKAKQNSNDRMMILLKNVASVLSSSKISAAITINNTHMHYKQITGNIEPVVVDGPQIFWHEARFSLAAWSAEHR